MPSFKLTSHSAYTPEQMFGIAADIERYPDFIRLIHGARVLDRQRDDDGLETFRSEIDIAYDKLNIHQTFSSQVRLDAQGLTIRSVSNEKPMKQLDSRWQFRVLPQGGSTIDYDIEYELASKILQFVMNKSFDYAMHKVVEAFERRARKLYGRPGTDKQRQAV